MSLDRLVQDLAVRARRATRTLTPLGRAEKDAALVSVAATIRAQSARILEANAGDVKAARAKGTTAALVAFRSASSR